MQSPARLAVCALSLAFAPAAFAKPPCRDGHGKFMKCPEVAEHHPICKIGKPCGNSCIAKDKVCHK